MIPNQSALCNLMSNFSGLEIGKIKLQKEVTLAISTSAHKSEIPRNDLRISALLIFLLIISREDFFKAFVKII